MAESVVIIQIDDFKMTMHRDAISKLGIKKLRKIIDLMCSGADNNAAAVDTMEEWLQEDAEAAKTAHEEANEKFAYYVGPLPESYWHSLRGADTMIRKLERDIERKERALKRANKRYTLFIERKEKLWQ